jgi:OOP family OmpA-OmpF porin
MKKIYGLAAATGVLLALNSPAKADTVPGWYAGAGALAQFPTDTTPSVAGTDNKITFGTGWGVLGDVGYAWPSGFRAEGELSYSRTTADQVKGVNATSGRINNIDLMGNLLYDFQTGTRWTPYIGGGIGLADVDSDHIGTLSNGGSINDSSAEFAYQGIAGVSYQVADHWSVTTDYRYIGTTDPKFKTTAGGTVNYGNASHNLVVGVRYTMHAPERPAPKLEEVVAPPIARPAPPPPPAVAPVTQNFTVFFDFNKTDITPEAQRVIALAAQTFKSNGYVHVTVTGHTDTVGSSQYNQKLSEARAEAVKQQLIADGVDPATIIPAGVGKTDLLVPTADNVRQVQNRRALIILDKQ